MAANNRKAISKGLRFDIFKRDSFTCQYCGAQPPNVVLHIDHIVPVVDGGDNDPLNLVTSCGACNIGKGAKRLEGSPRPDADLAWLEVQQELAELRRYQEAKKERDEVIKGIIELLQNTWFEQSGLDWAPSVSTITKMLIKNSPGTIEQAFMVVAPRVASGQVSSNNNEWLKYTYGVMKHMNSEDDQQ